MCHNKTVLRQCLAKLVHFYSADLNERLISVSEPHLLIGVGRPVLVALLPVVMFVAANITAQIDDKWGVLGEN